MEEYLIVMQYNRCLELAATCSFKLEVASTGFKLSNGKGVHMGTLETVNQVFNYLIGYTEGYHKGKLSRENQDGSK